MSDKRTQRAGDNSQQLQANNVTINIGIDEKRAREIYREMMNAVMVKNYTEEALNIATERVVELENRLLLKMEEVSALQAFADPGFQLLLVEAQKRAASTEREEDYDLLSELLIHRFQKGKNRNVRAGISRAIKIIDEISDDALLGLTVLHSVTYFVPGNVDIVQGLDVLNDLFGKVIYNQLPLGNEWLDHLDILDTIRISSLGKLKNIKQCYLEQLDGYVSVGIEKSSENHIKAVEILNQAHISDQILVQHALNTDYIRINLPNKNQIDSLVQQGKTNINGQPTNKPFSEEQKNAIRSVYDLYKIDGNIKDKNIEQFMIEWNKLPHLKKLQEWWDSIPKGFEITMVGRALAHCNAQRRDRTLPPLN